MTMGRPADSFSRGKNAPFDKIELEDFAKARAKGGTLKAAAGIAGVSLGTAATWEKHPEVKERMRELRQGVEDFVGVSKAWVLTQLKENALEAREESQFKASNEALKIIYEILNNDREVNTQVARALSPDVSRKELQRRLKESFSQPVKLPAIDVPQPEEASP